MAVVPVMVVPTVMPVVVMPMVVVMPVDHYGFDVIDLILRHEGVFDVCRRRQSRRFGRNRRYGSSLRGCDKHSRAHHQSSTEI